MRSSWGAQPGGKEAGGDLLADGGDSPKVPVSPNTVLREEIDWKSQRMCGCGKPNGCLRRTEKKWVLSENVGRDAGLAL